MINRLYFSLCFVICFFVENIIFLALGIKGYIVLLALVVLTLASNRIVVVVLQPPKLGVYVLGVIYLVTVASTAVYNKESAPLVFAGFFLLTFFMVMQTSYETAVRFVEVATHMFALFILLAMIGVLYYYAGGSPLFTLFNPDGREQSLYLTTFANAGESFIRPSAIYNEPGAFSFYICITVALRSLLGMSNRISSLLLVGGLITLSLAHVIFAAIWGVWAITSGGCRRINLKSISVLAFFLLLISIIYQSGLLDWTFERAVAYYENPWMNPRYKAFDDVRLALGDSTQGLWFGFNADCIARLGDCPRFGENPLTPLIYGGLLDAWPYYAFLLIAFTSPLFSRQGLIYAGVGALLLQRPYLLEFPYSAIMTLLLVVAIGGVKTRRREASVPTGDRTAARRNSIH
jgi:hypothetical protein